MKVIKSKIFKIISFIIVLSLIAAISFISGYKIFSDKLNREYSKKLDYHSADKLIKVESIRDGDKFILNITKLNTETNDVYNCMYWWTDDSTIILKRANLLLYESSEGE